jgi:hypothetical protein
VLGVLSGISRMRLAKVKPASLLKERHLQQQIADLLALDGWRRIRTEAGQVQAVVEQIRKLTGSDWIHSRINAIMDRFARSGRALQKGTADDLYMRPWTGCVDQISLPKPFESWVQHLFVETKIHTGSYRDEQITWAEEQRSLGFLVWQASTRNFKGDFEPTIDGFLSLYRSSGLMRRELRMP